MRVSINKVGIVLFCTTCLVAFASGAEKKSSKALPKEAAEAIRAVADSAKKRDFMTLRGLMVDEFTWSFGGDRDANQAIDVWKQDGRYLTELERVLRGNCRPAKAGHIECPGRGDLSFRAGFVKTPKGWKLEYFVEGD